MSHLKNKGKKKKKILKKEDLKPKITAEYPLPSNQEYLSYYVYQEEKCRPTKPIRPVSAMYSGPGPAIVSLPSLLGGDNPTLPKAPRFKMGLRWKSDILPGILGPGPANYDISDSIGGRGAVHFSTADRFYLRDRGTAALAPGPSDHNRETSDRAVYPRAPGFTMPQASRVKTAFTHSPGPNIYNLPQAFGSGKSSLFTSPSASFGRGKRDTISLKLEGPGPGTYLLPNANRTLSKAPCFTMASKSAPPTGITSSPGPGLYYDYLVKFNKYSTPRYTFGIRHSPYKAIVDFALEK